MFWSRPKTNPTRQWHHCQVVSGGPCGQHSTEIEQNLGNVHSSSRGNAIAHKRNEVVPHFRHGMLESVAAWVVSVPQVVSWSSLPGCMDSMSHASMFVCVQAAQLVHWPRGTPCPRTLPLCLVGNGHTWLRLLGADQDILRPLLLPVRVLLMVVWSRPLFQWQWLSWPGSPGDKVCG